MTYIEVLDAIENDLTLAQRIDLECILSAQIIAENQSYADEGAEAYDLDFPWRCFHCDFVTRDRAEAAAHFGDRDEAEPLCRLWKSLNADGRLDEYQDMVRQLNAEREENRRLEIAVEGLEYQVGEQESDIAQRFKGARSITQAWQQFDSMEGRALAAEERLQRILSFVEGLDNLTYSFDSRARMQRMRQQATEIK